MREHQQSLPVGDVGVAQGLDAIVTEADRGAAAGDTALLGVVLLAALTLDRLKSK